MQLTIAKNGPRPCQHCDTTPTIWQVNLLSRPHVVLFLGAMVTLVLANNALAAAFTKAGDCVVGKRVVNRDSQAGVIVSADGSSCKVKLDATGKIDYNIFWMLSPEASGGGRPSGAAATRTAGTTEGGSGGTIPTGVYKCYMLAGTTLNYAFIDINVTGSTRYRDKSGKSGSFTVDGAGKIAFTGPLAAANAKLLAGPRIGLNMNGGNFYNTTCSISR